MAHLISPSSKMYNRSKKLEKTILGDKCEITSTTNLLDIIINQCERKWIDEDMTQTSAEIRISFGRSQSDLNDYITPEYIQHFLKTHSIQIDGINNDDDDDDDSDHDNNDGINNSTYLL